MLDNDFDGVQPPESEISDAHSDVPTYHKSNVCNVVPDSLEGKCKQSQTFKEQWNLYKLAKQNIDRQIFDTEEILDACAYLWNHKLYAIKFNTSLDSSTQNFFSYHALV